MSTWAALVVGLGTTLAAQFGLDSWADESNFRHWIQHGLIFFGGLLAGAAVARLAQVGRRPV
ncbi:MAG TPA: hypothetical protein VE990_09980 [Acidimicrobiales bacterium]|nr:hypothetical protein [Acidimicrobiales bacterium]